MSPMVSFCLSMLITLSPTTDARYKIVARSRVTAESENLRLALDYVRSERVSSIICLVLADVRSDFADLVSEYVASEPIVSYRITPSDLSRGHTWQERVDLTWIFVVDSIDALTVFASDHSHIWKASNRYLIIVTARSVAALPREIFRDLWSNHSVHRLVVITIREGFRCLSRYLPFEKDQIRNEYGVMRKICLMDDAMGVETLYDKFERLNGYPIRVIVFPSLMMDVKMDKNNNIRYGKLDAQTMLLLEKSMGAQFRVKIIDHFGKRDPFHLTLRDIENHHSEMIITSFFVHKYMNFRRYEFTVGLFEDKLCLIAPAAGLIPKSYMPILPFESDLWAVLAVYNLLVSVLWFLVKYYSESFRRRDAVLLPLMRASGLVRTRRSDRVPPRVHPYVSSCFDLMEAWCYPLKESASGTTSSRAFLIGTLFFGLIVTGLYQSSLVSSLSKPFRYPELNTLKEVADSNYTIITKYFNLQQDTFMENTTLANRLKRKLVLFTSKEQTKEMVALGKNIALSRYASIKLDNLSMYVDEDGNELIHMVEECSTPFMLSYVVRLHSPYRDRVNDLLLRIQTAGLIELWYENMTYPMYAAEQRRKMAGDDRRNKLTMEHYSLTFLGLLLGLLSCVVVFLLELYFARRSGDRDKIVPHYYALANQLSEERDIAK